MTLRTSADYRAGLRDERRVFYQGKRVDNVASFGEFDCAITHSGLAFDIAAELPELAVADDGDGPYTAFYRVPRTGEDIANRGKLIEAVSRMGRGRSSSRRSAVMRCSDCCGR